MAGKPPGTPALTPGARVALGKDRDKATVRYVGPVDGHAGEWIGLEWDDPSRGKHDGSAGCKRYFDVSSGPTAGSFVRAEKVPSGVSLLAALRARYNNEVAEGAAPQAAVGGAVYLGNRPAGRVLVELVGEREVTERQRQTHLLVRARVADASVLCMDAAGDLAAALPSLQELDLSDNLLWRWDEPAALLAALPGLHTLNLSGNRLVLPRACGGSSGPAAPRLAGLRALVLNGCGVMWADVCALAASLPGLAELHIAGNGISCLDDEPGAAVGAPATTDAAATTPGAGTAADTTAPVPAVQERPELEMPGSSSGGCGEGDAVFALPRPIRSLQGIEVLGLEDNAIASWGEVLRLAWLPRLLRLNLCDNPIPCVRYPFGDSPPPGECGGRLQQGQCAQAEGAQPRSPTKQQQGQQQQPPLPPQQQQQQQQQLPEPGAQRPAFACLEALLLGGCRVASWRDVDELGRFPALRELRLSGNPLVQHAWGGRRFEIVARVPGLVLLNGADVRPRERRDCELRYLQAVAAEEAACADETARAALAAYHPRLGALRARCDSRDYAIPAAAAGTGASLASGAAAWAPAGGVTGGSAADTAAVGAVRGGTGGSVGGGAAVCEVVLRHGAKSSRKKLPAGTTIGALRLLCERLFRVKAARQALVLLPPGGCAGGCGDGGSDAVDIGGDDTKQLRFWDPEPGAVVAVYDREGRGAAAVKAAAA